MNSRKYRVCLVGVVVFALALGIFIYVKHAQKEEIPADGVLVRTVQTEDTDA